ncbi:MAG: 50S ribosomal protein L9 [Gammaproteobacteria bacterium]|nr:50S ribosomal protein L9 [Gammaproteobacteria bacterium]
MQVILLNKVENLGNLGDVVNVKSGYGRNYLFPTGKAAPATEANRKSFEARRAEYERTAAEALAGAQARRDRLAGVTVVIKRKVGDEGKLFGSVGTSDIADAFTALDTPVIKSEVRLPSGAIRQTGTYDISLHLHPEVNVDVKVEVAGEE